MSSPPPESEYDPTARAPSTVLPESSSSPASPSSELPSDVDSSAPETPIYTKRFWLAFTANMLLVTANTLTFRFAEYVKFLGGTEEITGRIVSFGLIGSLVLRAFLGQALDRFGVRRIWIISSMAYVIGCTMIILAPDTGVLLYFARVFYALGLASMLSASLAYVLTLAPSSRRTEMVASYGASGFLGMITGAQLGDILFHSIPEGRWLYSVLFGLTLSLGLLHFVMAMVMTTGQSHTRPQVTPPMHRLLVRYWPPLVFVVTTMMGMGFAVTMVFLTRYATELGLGGIRTFFSAYAITAFLMRIVTRNWSRTTGRHKLIVIGLVGQAAGQLLLVPVHSDWQFIPSAICCGFGHSLLFPCVVSLGAGAFPEQYRGTGTTIVLGAIDLGIMITAPPLGWMIDHYGFHPMLFTVSTIMAIASVTYAVCTWKVVDDEIATPRRSPRATARRKKALQEKAAAKTKPAA